LREVATRHRDAVVGREPAWSLVPDRERGLKQLTTEAEDALTAWWDANGVLAALQEATLRLLFAEESSRGDEPPRPAVSPLRLFIRSSSVGEDGRVPKRGSLGEALADIGIHACTPANAGVLRDADGDPIATRYSYRDETGAMLTELTGTGANLARLGLDVDATSDTLIVILNGNTPVGEPVAYPLGGALLMHEMRREPLITPAAIMQQKLINKAYTMMSRNVDVAGFVERTFLNAQAPGRWLGEDGQPTEPGKGTWTPDPLYVGAGATNHVVGVIEPREDGTYSYASPSVVYRDPVSPTAFTLTIEQAYRAVLEEAKQLHVLLAGDATASGESRKQAMSDYVDSLTTTAAQVQGAIRWLLTTSLRLAAVLINAPGRFDAFRVTASARIRVVQPTSEDQQATLAKYEAGVLSLETTLAELGVEDPTAEMNKLNATQPEVEEVAA
ncbi:MAG TPA: hypothetical protein VF202_05790, partial [Trueperaceae bacterium]